MSIFASTNARATAATIEFRPVTYRSPLRLVEPARCPVSWCTDHNGPMPQLPDDHGHVHHGAEVVIGTETRNGSHDVAPWVTTGRVEIDIIRCDDMHPESPVIGEAHVYLRCGEDEGVNMTAAQAEAVARALLARLQMVRASERLAS